MSKFKASQQKVTEESESLQDFDEESVGELYNTKKMKGSLVLTNNFTASQR